MAKAYKISKVLLEAINPNRTELPEGIAFTQKGKSIRVDGELPVLPEYLKDFAFRYALEYRSQADWARVFHVATATIGQWVRRPDVLKYVMTIRFERRLRLLEMTEQAENKALKKLNEILEQKVTSANVNALLQAIFKTLSMVKEGKVPSEPSETNFNVTLNQTIDNRQIHANQEQIQAQLEELEAVERQFQKTANRNMVVVGKGKR